MTLTSVRPTPLLNVAPLTPLRVALLGCGVVGSEVARLIIEQAEDLRGTYLVVLTAAEVEFALAVDQLMRQEEVVIKPLDSLLRTIKEFSGAAILGDGSVTLIADVPALSSQARRIAQQHNRRGTLEPVGAK